MLPNEIQVLIAAVVIFVVTAGLKSLSALVGKDLSGYGAALAALIVASFVLFFNGFIAILPAGWQAIVAQVLQLLVLFIGAAGVHSTAKRFSK